MNGTKQVRRTLDILARYLPKERTALFIFYAVSFMGMTTQPNK
jgi:hypothetical protein